MSLFYTVLGDFSSFDNLILTCQIPGTLFVIRGLVLVPAVGIMPQSFVLFGSFGFSAAVFADVDFGRFIEQHSDGCISKHFQQFH